MQRLLNISSTEIAHFIQILSIYSNEFYISNYFQVYKDELEEKISELQQQNESISLRLAAADRFAAEVEQAAENGGRQLSNQIKEALASFKSSLERSSAAAAALESASSPPPSSTSSRPMI